VLTNTGTADVPTSALGWPGEIRHVRIGSLELENGVVLADAAMSYACWGRLNATRSNAVLLHHGLMSGVRAAPTAEKSDGWFSRYIGAGRPLDPASFWICCPNVLGGSDGSTGPPTVSPSGTTWGVDFPMITVRDQVAAERLLAATLGISQWRLVVGPSMGGMRTLEWLIEAGDAVAAALVLGCAPASTAAQAAVRAAQMAMIRADPHFHGGCYDIARCPSPMARCRGPLNGLLIARMSALPWYLTDEFLAQRAGEQPSLIDEDDKAERVTEYIRRIARRDVRQFDANSFITLTQAMNSHDVGRGRGGIDNALGGIRSPVIVVGVETDRCYPVQLASDLARAIPSTRRLIVTGSPYGHDAVVADPNVVVPALEEALAL
jgi:homoserine O-acetyltransferase